MKRLFLIITILIALSCTKNGPDINPYFAEIYPQILDQIDIECVESNEEFYISAFINGTEFCHDQKKVGEFKLFVTNKFTTSSPNISTGEDYDDARHGLQLKLGTSEHRSEHFVIKFPDFNLNRAAQIHLDSLINFGTHDVMGKEHVNIPEGTSNVDEILLHSGGGFLNNFLIELESKDVYTETGGGNVFIISSIFGNQDGSYLKFKKVEKTDEDDGIYYYLDIEFECNLYHWPQYGYEGLWGEVRNGRIIVKVRLED